MPKAVWRLPKKEKTVFLTFDDGPIPEVTPFVLDLLREKNIKATFFCVGDNVRKYPEVFKQVVTEGHQIGNHTFNHLQGFKNSLDYYADNVEKADELIKSPFFRPPHGQFSFFHKWKLRKNYSIILWDLVTRDYNRKLSGEKVFSIVQKYVRNGSVIVFHDSLKAEKNLRYALPKTIDFLIKEGYKFEVITEDTIKQKSII
jgi:peptidoglycan/xylan/chitin deacetylase (PgdA/CDA1 family)